MSPSLGVFLILDDLRLPELGPNDREAGGMEDPTLFARPFDRKRGRRVPIHGVLDDAVDEREATARSRQRGRSGSGPRTGVHGRASRTSCGSINSMMTTRKESERPAGGGSLGGRRTSPVRRASPHFSRSWAVSQSDACPTLRLPRVQVESKARIKRVCAVMDAIAGVDLMV